MPMFPWSSEEQSPETCSTSPFWSRLLAEQKSEKPFRTGKLVLRAVTAAVLSRTAMVLTRRTLRKRILTRCLTKVAVLVDLKGQTLRECDG